MVCGYRYEGASNYAALKLAPDLDMLILSSFFMAQRATNPFTRRPDRE